jgi:hypothetical protein
MTCGARIIRPSGAVFRRLFSNRLVDRRRNARLLGRLPWCMLPRESSPRRYQSMLIWIKDEANFVPPVRT